MSDEQGSSSILYILAPIGVLAVLLIAGYFLWQTYSTQSQQQVQTGQTYTNSQYGFSLQLPDSWTGYLVMIQSWQGRQLDNNAQFQGPQIVLRSPKWTQVQLWQDIPIMIFTKDEWKLVQAQNLAVSAAPIGPQELGENQNYVFALPPRWYGFTDAQGQDEAVQITQTFKAF
jgi:hypothetical protein